MEKFKVQKHVNIQPKPTFLYAEDCLALKECNGMEECNFVFFIICWRLCFDVVVICFGVAKFKPYPSFLALLPRIMPDYRIVPNPKYYVWDDGWGEVILPMNG